MSEFSATDAAFEGFRVARERPWAIAAWAGVALAMGVAQDVLRGALVDPKIFEELMRLAQAGQPDPARLTQLYGQLIPFMAAIIPISLLYYGIMFAAAFRVVLEPKSSVNGLRLGIQELRQVLLLIIIGLLMFFVYLGVLFIGAALTGVVAMMSRPLAAVAAVVSLLASIGVLIFVPIRLSLAGPHTFADHRLRPFASWSMTRGRFWPMAGAYLLATIFALIVTILCMLILAGVFAATGQTLTAMLQPTTTIAAFFTPMHIIYRVGSAVLNALTWAILVCPAAVIFRQLNREAVF
ncbi:MAG: hypothetical protein JWO33_573 [Caulobacteraceae bacterium]|nr:hypothetical protein [Caulobacteraceae bacterium]